MFINTSFTFDNITSDTYNLMLCKLDIGLIEGQFGIKRSIIEEKVTGKSSPYFFGLEDEPLTFTTILAREKEWDYETRNAVARWLFKNDYRDFVSTDNPNIVYKCICIDNPTIALTGNSEGYITLNWRCDGKCPYSPVYLETFDLTSNTTTTTITIENKSNLNEYYYPEIEFTLSGDSTGFKLKNLTDSGRESTFTTLNTEEKVYVNNQRKQIISDDNVYRYGNFNNNWFRLVYGINQIQVTGKGTLAVRSQFPIMI